MRGTILVTVSRGIITRNLLTGGALQSIAARGWRLVLLTPAHDDLAFVEAFVRPSAVVALPFPRFPWSRWDELFASVQRGLIWNRRTDLIAKVGQLDASETNAWKYWSYRAAFQPLSRLRFLRDLVRWLDLRLLPVKEFDALFAGEKPAAVFLTNVMEYEDMRVGKAARLHGVPVIAMPKSWDNLSKTGFRLKPDRMVVWSPFMRDETVRFQSMRADRVDIVGVPQFDVYHDPEKRLSSREAFCEEIGLDPSRPYVLYASEGKVTPNDGEAVAVLADAVADGRLSRDLQILVRPHYGYRNELAKFAALRGRLGIVFDEYNEPSPAFHDQWDWSEKHWHRLGDSLFHAAAVVTTASTITVDATALDRPVVNIGFDTRQGTLPYEKSMTHWYDTEHYCAILESGVPEMATTPDALVAAVADALTHPERKTALRAAFRDRFCGPLDGRAGERVAEAVDRFAAAAHH